MAQQLRETEQHLAQLFYDFVDAGLHGRFEEALSLVTETYMGIGMGDQGIFHNREEAAEIIFQDRFIPSVGTTIELESPNLTINFLSDDVAVVFGEIIIISTPSDGSPLRSGLMQTLTACRSNGEWRIAYTHASPSILTEESIKGYPVRFLDQPPSAEQAEAQTLLHRDPLTGVLNRKGLELRAAQLLQDYNPRHNTALFMVDLDDFKQINDRLGHQVGDAVLQQVAVALRKTFRECDAISRIGGDEFMVLLTGDFSGTFLEKKADDLLNSVRLRMDDRQAVPISISIGIAYGRARTTFEKFYRIADIALYTAKKAGKCRYHLVNADTNAQRSYNGGGASLLSLQTLLDYTDGKDVLESKTPYEALVENIPGGVVMYEFTDTSIKVTHCNEWFARYLGYTEEEIERIEADDVLVLVHPEDVPMMLDAAQSIRDGVDSNSVIYRVRHKNGSYSHINQITSVTERRAGSIIVYGIEADVEEAVRLKNEVEKAHNRLEALISTIPGAVVIVTLTDHVHLEHCNNWPSRFTGYSVEELETMQRDNVLAIVHPDDVAMVHKNIQHMYDGVDEVHFVYRVRHKSGSYRHVQFDAARTEQTADRIVFHGVETDVEETYRLKQKVEDSQRDLETLIANVPGSVVLFEFTDAGIRSLHRNAWLSTLLGYTEEELAALQGDDPMVICHPDDWAHAQAAVQSIRDGADSNSIVYRVRHKDGSYSHMAQTVSVVSRQPGSIIMYGIETDVEETYRLKQQIEESQKKLEALLNAIPGGVLAISLSDRVELLHRNLWLARFLGYNAQELDELKRGDAFALVHPEDMPLFDSAIERLHAGAQEATVTYRLRGKDGSYRRVRIHISAVERHPEALLCYAVVTAVEESLGEDARR